MARMTSHPAALWLCRCAGLLACSLLASAVAQDTRSVARRTSHTTMSPRDHDLFRALIETGQARVGYTHLRVPTTDAFAADVSAHSLTFAGPTSGATLPCASNRDCDDELFCNGVEICVGQDCLQDDSPCSGQFCDEFLDECVECLVNGDCDDGNACTIGSCESGACTYTPIVATCNDGNPCTDDDACAGDRCLGNPVPGCAAEYSIKIVAVDGAPNPAGPTEQITIFSLETVTIEMFVSNWGPQTLRLYDVLIDPDSYTSGTRGSLFPPTEPDLFAGMDIELDRPDYVFFGANTIVAGVFLNLPDQFSMGAFVFDQAECVTDVGETKYVSTMRLKPSIDASGLFTICMDDTDANGDLAPENTVLFNCDDLTLPIFPVEFSCVTITVIPDCNDNGISDDLDIADGTSGDCTMNAIPDECEPDCDDNGTADLCDLLTGRGSDCNANGTLDECDIAGGTSLDCNLNEVPDTCDLSEGTSLDCNDNLIPDTCEEDCNANTVPDDCDVSSGTSEDCDADQIPDECQDTSLDCNANGVWDACDLSEGTSPDCNENLVPDECDIATSGNPALPAASFDCDQNGLPDECIVFFPGILEPETFTLSDGITLNGGNQGDTVGQALAGGDINGDGVDDLIIGAPRGDGGGVEDAGEVYCVFGSPSGLASPIDLAALRTPGNPSGFVIEGIGMVDLAGRSVAVIGDFNDDGIDDLVAGARFLRPGVEEIPGGAYVVFGAVDIGSSGPIRAAELDGANGFVIRGTQDGDLAGVSVSAAGDVNDDGIPDLLVGASRAFVADNLRAGRAFLLFGGADPRPALFDLASLLPENGGDGSAGIVFNGITPQDMCGASVAGIGDFNGDGIDDIAIGAWGADPFNRFNAGQTYVVFGSPTIASQPEFFLADLDGDNGLAINGIDPVDLSSQAIAGANDVNNDGADDLLIGAVFADPSDASNAGESYLVFGGPGPWPANFELFTLREILGGDGSAGVIFNGIRTGDFSGFSVAGPGDLNGDGIADLTIGAFSADDPALFPNFGANVGEAYTIFGHDDPWPPEFELSTLRLPMPEDQATGFIIRGNDLVDQLATVVARIGDVNNDGAPDLGVGAPNADPDGITITGAAYVVYGRNPFQSDCNGNAVWDLCDITDGTSEDCDGNRVPDSCDITQCAGSNSCGDCNANGIIDACDILGGTSSDVDGDRLPDECTQGVPVANHWGFIILLLMILTVAKLGSRSACQANHSTR